MDAENIKLEEENGNFKFVWIVEAMSHFIHKEAFLAHANRLLSIDGRICIADWVWFLLPLCDSNSNFKKVENHISSDQFRAEHLTRAEEEKYIKPIEEGMLLHRLNTVYEYITFLKNNG